MGTGNGADTAQETLNREAAAQTQQLNHAKKAEQVKRSPNGDWSTEIDLDTELETSRELERVRFLPDVVFPLQMPRIVDEAFSVLERLEREGIDGQNSTELEEAERLGLVVSKDGEYDITSMLDSEQAPYGIKQVLNENPYNWLHKEDTGLQTFHSTLSTPDQTGNRIEALHLMAEEDPVKRETLEALTGVDSRQLGYDLHDFAAVEFSGNELGLTNEGYKLRKLTERIYERMVEHSQRRANGYELEIENRREFEDQPLIQDPQIAVSGHRELIGRILDEKYEQIPEELEAFEDY